MLYFDTFRFNNLTQKIVIGEYPPVPMTSNNTLSNGETGYRVICSSVLDSTVAEFKLFDKTTTEWVNSTTSFNPTTGLYRGTSASTFDGQANVLGEVIQIKLPSAIQLSSYSIMSRNGALGQTPRKWRLYGANSETPGTFTFIEERASETGWTDNLTRTYTLSTASAAFPVYRIVIMENNGDTAGGGYLAVAEWRLFTSQIKIGYANEYPPIAMTADTTSISGQTYGNGTYTISSNVTSQPALFSGFDKNITTFLNLNSGTYSATSPFAYNGSVSTIVSGVPTLGDFVDLVLPLPIALTSYSLQPRNDAAFGQICRSWSIAGSNDGTIYELIEARSNIIWVQGVAQTFPITSPSIISYKRYRLIIQAANQFPSIMEIRYFGLE